MLNTTSLTGAELDADLVAQFGQLTALVEELTRTMVVQGAWVSALRNGRSTPQGVDIDDAIAHVAVNVPEGIADSLWELRDVFLASIHADPTR